MTYNIVLVSNVQQSVSDIYTYIYIYILFQSLFACRLLQNTEYSSLCYTVHHCWLSIFYIYNSVHNIYYILIAICVYDSKLWEQILIGSDLFFHPSQNIYLLTFIRETVIKNRKKKRNKRRKERRKRDKIYKGNMKRH